MIILLISSASFAHKGKHETFKLPKYELEKSKGFASLKINEVAGNYLVSFISPLYNFTQVDKHAMSQSEITKSIIEKLKNPAHIFSTKSFKCALANQPTVIYGKKLRTISQEMSRKEVPIKEQDKHAEYFASITAQYKLVCKKPIKFEKMNFRAFTLAPFLQEVNIFFNTRSEGIKKITIRQEKSSSEKKNPSVSSEKSSTKDLAPKEAKNNKVKTTIEK
ncbi:ZrgA family zinc uptake protein [Pseudobacteriovorax antillogorgiicola]|nr:DUF2796 domain-containing protein [Pseudobacteriovorax antillogorgiicola]